MRPTGELNEILVVYTKEERTYRYSEGLFSKERDNPLTLVKLKDGLARYRFHFSEVGTLLSWDRYTYLQVIDSSTAHVEERKYNNIRVLDGVYQAKVMERLMKGLKVKEPVDVETPLEL